MAPRIQKRVVIVLLLCGLLFFSMMIWPNLKGAKDPAMVSVFSPDEAAQYPHVMRMVIPGNTPRQTFHRFFYYQHYYYGFPFYLTSAVLALAPVKYSVGLGSTTANLFALRQVVSVLPMILTVFIFVYLQTRFQKLWASVFLFILLLTIPAVFKNSTWWHPDSLTMLFIALTFFFLDRDDFDYGWNFHLAAATCGLATGTKLLGLFFFLTIPLYLLLGIVQKRITLGRAVGRAISFLVVMFVIFIVSDPFLLDPEQRQQAIRIQTRQADAMNSGWNVLYARGPLAWYPMIREYYGELSFILLAFCAALAAIVRNQRRWLNVLILSFVIPFLTYVFSVIVIKPHHFLLPAAIPLFSAIGNLFWLVPESGRRYYLSLTPAGWLRVAAGFLVSIILVWQFAVNLAHDFRIYQNAVYKEEWSEEVSFFHEVESGVIEKLGGGHYTLFRDIRIYFPDRDGWGITARSKMATYPIIQQGDYDLVLMWNQRALDYTQAGVLENAVDPVEMEQAFAFYSDVRKREMDGYILVYETACCSAFLKENLYMEKLK